MFTLVWDEVLLWNWEWIRPTMLDGSGLGLGLQNHLAGPLSRSIVPPLNQLQLKKRGLTSNFPGNILSNCHRSFLVVNTTLHRPLQELLTMLAFRSLRKIVRYSSLSLIIGWGGQMVSCFRVETEL